MVAFCSAAPALGAALRVPPNFLPSRLPGGAPWGAARRRVARASVASGGGGGGGGWAVEDVESEAGAEGGGRNALAGETSRYLVDSALDAVNWQPWGETAFRLARSSNKPILLSSGFLSCHMCAVMSKHFNLPHISSVLNAKFVCIKVDREERPDVDNMYSIFTQAVTGRSGWPLTCFLTPDLVPFVGTTYLPADRLANAVESIASRWTENKATVEADGAKVLGALRDLFGSSDDASVQIGVDMLQAGFEAAYASFDIKFGGFGSVPKFARPALIEFLIGLHTFHQPSPCTAGRESLEMVLATLHGLAAGGICDQLGGGFFRYALDAAWYLPHFEKLLSDQAQLALCFLQAFLITNNEEFRVVTQATLDFCLAEMKNANTGAFFSALHADSQVQFDIANGTREGAYYTYSEFELKLMLGEPAATIFCMRFGVTSPGNVSASAVAEAELEGLAGQNVFRISASIQEITAATGCTAAEVIHILSNARAKLLAERSRRPHPEIDDLVIVSWNGMIISALVRAGASLGEERYIDAGMKAMDFLMDEMCSRTDESRDAIYLARAYRADRGRVEAFAEDYANAVMAAIDCFEVSGKGKYLVFARRLQNALDSEFWGDGGYYTSRHNDLSILVRRKEDYDGSEPSPSSITALNCVRMASLLGEDVLWDKARAIVQSFSSVLYKTPLAMPMLLVSIQAFAAAGPKKVVVVGDNVQASEMLQCYWGRGLPRSVALLRVPIDGTEPVLESYLSRSRRGIKAIDGLPTAYVCTGLECLEPTTCPTRFAEQLDYLSSVQAGHAELKI